MVLLGDIGQLEACCSLFGDTVNLDAGRCTVCAKHTLAQKSFWTHLIVLLGDINQVEAHFNSFGDSFNSGAR
jgi:hypothetical protein